MVDSFCQTELELLYKSDQRLDWLTIAKISVRNFFLSFFQDIFVYFKPIFLEKNIVLVFKIATCTKSCQFTISTAKIEIN